MSFLWAAYTPLKKEKRSKRYTDKIEAHQVEIEKDRESAAISYFFEDEDPISVILYLLSLKSQLQKDNSNQSSAFEDITVSWFLSFFFCFGIVVL
jgi:hypothetical protein